MVPVAMTPGRTTLPPARYTLKRATEEIADRLRVRGRGSRKEVALAIGLTEQAFSHKMRGVYTSLDIEEIGRIATYLDAPTGWPWISWSEGERIDATLPPRRK
jgi:hypothetical protein